MGRLGKSFGPSWAPKPPPRCATWPPRQPQDATKTYSRAAQNTSQDALGSPRPPRTSKTSKITPKSRWGTPRGLVFGANMGAFGPSTQLLCDFFKGAVAGSQLCCAVDPPRQALCLRMAYRVPYPNQPAHIPFLLIILPNLPFPQDIPRTYTS